MGHEKHGVTVFGEGLRALSVRMLPRSTEQGEVRSASLLASLCRLLITVTSRQFGPAPAGTRSDPSGPCRGSCMRLNTGASGILAPRMVFYLQERDPPE